MNGNEQFRQFPMSTTAFVFVDVVVGVGVVVDVVVAVVVVDDDDVVAVAVVVVVVVVVVDVGICGSLVVFTFVDKVSLVHVCLGATVMVLLPAEVSNIQG